MRALTFASLPVALLCASLSAQPLYFPAAQWRTATPESQGIDSTALAAALDQVTEKHLGVHSLLVIRHGYVVADAYFYPYAASAPHDLASVTKTITSTLTGVAVGRGLIKLSDKVLSFFPDQRPAVATEARQRITIGDLVRMESGLDCGYAPGEQELEQMKRSPDWVRFALALPVKYDLRHALVVLQPRLSSARLGDRRGSQAERAGFRHEVFVRADRHPHGHLGHRSARPQSRLGRQPFLSARHGADRLSLPARRRMERPADRAARLGRNVNGAVPTAPRGEPGGMGYEWNSSNGPNGRQFGGTGRGGQSLIVWPDLDMVVVSMGGGNTGQVAQWVRQAVKSDAPLPADPEAVRRLQTKTAAVARPPAPEPTAALPALAQSVSGAVYEFPVNPSRFDSLSLTFQNQSEARVTVKYYGEPFTFSVGLDGVYRLSPTGPMGLPGGAWGKWTSDREFLLDLNFVANINHYTLAILFQGDHIEVTANEASGLIRNGRLTGTRK